MFIRIGCVDGHTYQSDSTTEQELQDILDAADGYIGTGDLATHRFEPVDEVLDLMLEVAKYDSSNDSQTISLEINGIKRHFNVIHIVWYEVVRDSDEKRWSENA